MHSRNNEDVEPDVTKLPPDMWWQLRARSTMRGAFGQMAFAAEIAEVHQTDCWELLRHPGPKAVWLIQTQDQRGDTYRVYVAESAAFTQKQVLGSILLSRGLKYPEDTAESEGAAGLERVVQQAGRDLGRRVNEACVSVLAAASQDARQTAPSSMPEFRRVLAYAADALAAEGQSAGYLLTSGSCFHRLLESGLIHRESSSGSELCVGQTQAGLRVYRVDEITEDTAYLVGESSMHTVMWSTKCGFEGGEEPYTQKLWGWHNFHPIVPNVSSVVAFTGFSNCLGSNRFGRSIEPRVDPAPYVDQGRIDDLRDLQSDAKLGHDLAKLVRLCEELNQTWASGCYYATALLVRTIVDHVPPVFGCSTFGQVCSQHGGKSIKESLNNLNDSARAIADHHLHSQIQRKEVIPTNVQVDCHQNLDVLLQEVIRELR